MSNKENNRNHTELTDSSVLNESQKTLEDLTYSCRSEIESVLTSKPMIAPRGGYWYDETISLSAYLLSKTKEYKTPVEVEYETLVSGIDNDIADAVKRDRVEHYWSELAKLAGKYSEDVFKCVTSLDNLTSSMRTPLSVEEIAVNLLDIKEKDAFADLCCGRGAVANFIKSHYPKTKVYGYDIDGYPIAVAKAYSESSKLGTEFIKKDIFELATEKKKFSKVFANYPFGTRLKDLKEGKNYLENLESRIPAMSKATSSDWLYNMAIVDLLEKGGKAVGVMTTGSTWNIIDAPIRQYFVENGLVEAVISLPAKLFTSPSVATSIIVFSHGNKGVRLVDASELYVQGRRLNVLGEEDIDKILDSAEADSDISIFVSKEELKDNDYVLNSKRYTGVGNNIKYGAEFGSVVKRITRGAPLKADDLDKLSSPVPTDAQYLMLANVKDGLIDNDLPYIKEIEKSNEKYCLSNHCLILSKNGYPYKIAVAELKEGQRILANGNLYIIELDEAKVNPYYLAAFLGSENGTAALKSITVGATIPNIGVEQLKKLIIPVPSLEEQKKIADRYLALRDEVTMLQLKLEKAKNKMAHIFDEGGEI